MKNFKPAILFILMMLVSIAFIQQTDVHADDVDNVVTTVGDVDKSGKIDARDVTLLRRFLVGGWGVTLDFEDADIDQSGKVDAKDVTLLRRYLAGGWGVVLPKKSTNSSDAYNSKLRVVYEDGTQEEFDVTKGNIELSGNPERVYFGMYPQTSVNLSDAEWAIEPNRFGMIESNGSRYTKRQINGGTRCYKWEDIEWRVIKVEDGENGKRMLLVSENILDAIPFNETSETVTWEDSDIRSWLNGEFYYNAFGGGAWKAVSAGRVSGKRNDGSIYETEDRVFLLSIDEAKSEEYGYYVKDPEESGKSGASFRKMTDMANADYWWCRDGYFCDEISGNSPYRWDVALVYGNLSHCNGIRPAVWVSLEGPSDDVSGDPAKMKVLGRQQERTGTQYNLKIECHYVNEAGIDERKIQYISGTNSIAEQLGFLELDYWYDEQGKIKKYYVNRALAGGIRFIETEYD
ncbi:MAG: dockerin type I repeat-containing protein, partial [Lachnospiraceae bacterium]|nr:dockerin type I repeat-containing protein [Lachnospiraceae bacterium]